MLYEEFDKILMAEIWAGRNKMEAFMTLDSPVRVAAESYIKKDSWLGKARVARVIERRLQALRQEGRIKWSDHRWEIVDRRK